MHIIYALEGARSTLVAPKRCAGVGSQVRESAVAQLEQLVPLHCVIAPGLSTAESDGIVHNMLYNNKDRPAYDVYDEDSVIQSINYLPILLTNLPIKSPYLNSHTGACSRYTEI